jgi:acyl-CoA thioester hydrolase
MGTLPISWQKGPHLNMETVFEKTLVAGWRDMDYNSHMANTAYLDRAADVRMMYFAENGFTAADMLRMKIGPVIMKDEIEYYREVQLLQEIRVRLSIAGLAPDGSRFMLRNEFAHADGTRCAAITSTGGWLDLNVRKLIAPPAPLRAAMEALPKVDGFRELKSSVR